MGARNRKGLEKLCRYIARPPLAKSRIVDDGGGEYRILLKTPWSDGTTSIQLSLLELMERLAALVPPPRAHQVLYHGGGVRMQSIGRRYCPNIGMKSLRVNI